MRRMAVAVVGRLKYAAEAAWYQRGKVPLLRMPIPWRLPYGGWFLAHGDAMGARIVGYHLAGHPYEEGHWKFVRDYLDAGMVVCDVGANQGFYTLLASRVVGASGQVIAFEPAATEYAKLLRNLALNRCDNVVAENKAVGARSAVERFHHVRGHQGSWSSLRQPASDVESDVEVCEVSAVTLDEYAKARSLHRLDVVKIDVEGGELDVLRGAQQVLTRFRPVVLCEVEQRRADQWGYDAADIIEFLRRLHYDWHRADSLGRLGRLDERDVDAWENLVAIPAETIISPDQREAQC